MVVVVSEDDEDEDEKEEEKEKKEDEEDELRQKSNNPNLTGGEQLEEQKGNPLVAECSCFRLLGPIHRLLHGGQALYAHAPNHAKRLQPKNEETFGLSSHTICSGPPYSTNSLFVAFCKSYRWDLKFLNDSMNRLFIE